MRAGSVSPVVRRSRSRLAWTAASVLLAAPLLSAQTQPNLEVLRPYVGAIVVVHDASGGRSSGRLIEAAAGGLTLSVDRVRRVFQPSDIASVGVIGDPIWDGALKGAAVG